MNINVSVSSGENFNEVEENVFFDITFTITTGFTYAANSNVYYSALLTDSNSATREVTFSVSHDTQGAIADGAVITFTFENTTNLVPTITPSDGRIFYVAV